MERPTPTNPYRRHRRNCWLACAGAVVLTWGLTRLDDVDAEPRFFLGFLLVSGAIVAAAVAGTRGQWIRDFDDIARGAHLVARWTYDDESWSRQRRFTREDRRWEWVPALVVFGLLTAVTGGLLLRILLAFDAGRGSAGGLVMFGGLFAATAGTTRFIHRSMRGDGERWDEPSEVLIARHGMILCDRLVLWGFHAVMKLDVRVNPATRALEIGYEPSMLRRRPLRPTRIAIPAGKDTEAEEVARKLMNQQ